MDDITIRTKNMNSIIDRLTKIRQNADPDSKPVKAALTRAAIMITSQAKLNIRRQGLIDTGRLLNSLRWEFYKRGDVSGVQIGSFGVPYAAFWEFGYYGQMPVRAHNRLITKAFGKPLKKSVIARVRGHVRTRIEPARPYLKPAYMLHRERIVEIFMDAAQK